mgnify:CR=1 FL=1
MGNLLTYDYEEENVFSGGNEFRQFDVRNTYYKGLGIKYFTHDSIPVAYLYPDFARDGNAFTLTADQNGEMYINTHQGSNDSTEADYVWAHFTFNPSFGGELHNVYVFGGISDWQIKPECLLTYNDRDGVYEGDVLVKQGVYDYRYATQDDAGLIDLYRLEGNHWETSNTYTVYVYYHPYDLDADKLVAVKKVKFNSR